MNDNRRSFLAKILGSGVAVAAARIVPAEANELKAVEAGQYSTFTFARDRLLLTSVEITPFRRELELSLATGPRKVYLEALSREELVLKFEIVYASDRVPLLHYFQERLGKTL